MKSHLQGRVGIDETGQARMAGCLVSLTSHDCSSRALLFLSRLISNNDQAEAPTDTLT